jgi:factor associated with neutral sphingomyelinase activation
MVSDLCLSKNGETLYSVSKDTFLKVYSISERRQLRSVSPCNLALSSCALDNQQQKTITLGSWDNNVYIYSVDYGRILDSLCAHDDAVSTIRLQQDVLATGSWDSTVKVWKHTPTGLTRTPLAHYTENDAMIKCVDLSPGGNLVIAGAADGHVMYADLRERGKAKNLRLHGDSVNSISFTNNGDKVISCSNDGSIRITEFGGNDLFTIRAEEPLRTFATDGTILFAGGESGRVRAWDLSLGNEITGAGLQSCRGGPINKLVVNKDASLLVVGCEDATIQTFQL